MEHDLSFGSRSLDPTGRLRFTLRIERFSAHARKGLFEGPAFPPEEEEGGEESSTWSLVVSSDYEHHIEVRLRRSRNHSGRDQFVKARLSLLGVFGWRSLARERELLFGRRSEEEAQQLLVVTKGQAFGLLGANRLRYLPGDSLTLLCEILLYEDSVRPFHSFEELEKSSGRRSPVHTREYFAHSTLTPRECVFVQRFRNFRTYSNGLGRFEGRNFSDSADADSRWSLVVATCVSGDFPDDFLKVCLKRSGIGGLHVEARVSIVHRFRTSWVSGEKKIYFRGSEEGETHEVLTVSRKDRWFGLQKWFLVPDDTLTLRCEMVIYEEDAVEILRREDFNSRLRRRRQGRRGGMERVVPQWLKKYLFFAALVVVFACIVRHAVFNLVIPFVQENAVVLILNAAIFMCVVWQVLDKLFTLRSDAENRNGEESRSHSPSSDQQVVPYQNREAAHYQNGRDPRVVRYQNREAVYYQNGRVPHRGHSRGRRQVNYRERYVEVIDPDY